MQNNSKIIFIVFLFIIVLSFVGVEKMTDANCGSKTGKKKLSCLKNHINNVLDPDNKYYRYHNGNPRYGAGPIKTLNGKIIHFENMITAFNSAKNEGSKYCAGMTDNKPKIKCLKEKTQQTSEASLKAIETSGEVELAYAAATKKAESSGAKGKQSTLLFSAYGEGSANNKFLEIYNRTNEPIDLSNYAIANVSNQPDVTGEHEYLTPLTGFIPANGTYTICHQSASDNMKNQVNCDIEHSYLSNGDDGYCLVGDEVKKIDCIGDFNGDPGSGWDVCGTLNATKDHSLRRKCSVTTGNAGDWDTSRGTDKTNCEWEVYSKNTWNETYAAKGCGAQTR